MRKAFLTLGIVGLLAAQAFGITQNGNGARVYWEVAPDGPFSQFNLWKAEFDCNYTPVGSVVNFDNEPFNNTYGSWTRIQRRGGLEVYDRRDAGGAGNLVMPTIINNTPPSGGYAGADYNQPWDIVKINPNTKVHALLCDGSLGGAAGWSTQYLGPVLTAPANWKPGTTSNGISLAAVQGIWGGAVRALYDSNNNGVIDNVSTEGSQYGYGNQPTDVEFGGDKAVYMSYGNQYTTLNIARFHILSSGAGAFTEYFNSGNFAKFAKEPVVDGAGIAVDPRPSPNPIVYFLALDNNVSAGSHLSIWAARDTDGDNTITASDTLKEIWQQGKNSLNSYSDSAYGGEDLEIWVKSDGSRSLLFNDYAGDLFALDLADNGLAAVGTGTTVLSGIGPSGYGAGFELDPNPVPEPMTLALLGTGALGAVSWMRRRRVR